MIKAPQNTLSNCGCLTKPKNALFQCLHERRGPLLLSTQQGAPSQDLEEQGVQRRISSNRIGYRTRGRNGWRVYHRRYPPRYVGKYHQFYTLLFDRS